MPDSVMTAMAVQDSAITLGSNSQIGGSANTPKRAVNTIRTAVSLSRKYLSTRNLSIWVETAQQSGPEKAYNSHMLFRGPPYIFSYFGMSTSVTGVRGAVPVSITRVTARWTGGLPGAGRQSCGASRGITKLPPAGIFITG